MRAIVLVSFILTYNGSFYSRKNFILAGHRRRRACMQLGIKEVDVEVRDFDSS